MAAMSPLRQRMIEDMTIRNLSLATQQSYIYAIAKFSRHFGCSPDRLSLEQVRAYQLHLIKQKRSWSHINQVACALRFFYGVTLGTYGAFERIVGGQKPDKLPLVLNAEEVARFLQAVSGLRNRIALTTAYAAGLRVHVLPNQFRRIRHFGFLANARRASRAFSRSSCASFTDNGFGSAGFGPPLGGRSDVPGIFRKHDHFRRRRT